ncbi:Putative S-adenosyl-L-methionine-dependent methyltransferase [Mycobacterium attenuatum]|uniref:S-adenosyl-L-methionine-dependent methyltransferase n=2 Tax=Mycobacterium attenuatum TaxID=2341086 RepID=A0A498PTA9_9MYCO|nr:Putative S-adenosyl-L-methionine-dependent methyltransferase [Mycobacterium attenuatum]VBA47569.1 Putative S-adenosyl-L-methionine-dependent methyltransferase [Mycobacterium attenuatum]
MRAGLARVAVAAAEGAYSLGSSLYWLNINVPAAEGKRMTQVGSARFEGDTWDLASSVGLTATMVAAARAVACRDVTGAGAVASDNFAEPLVKAVGVDFFSRLASGELDPGDLDDDTTNGIRHFADAMAVRTRFFDDFFADAARAGIRQAVILASGLDSRAYRLRWPAGTTVFEVDQPQVIEFKTATLAELGVRPSADRRPVAVDLRDDWPAALHEAGFDPGRPSAWTAEGLLGYLPARVQDRLLDQVTANSAPGSRFATEGLLDVSDLNREELRRRMYRQKERWNRHGFDLDMAALMYFDGRTDAGTYLAAHGWQTTGVSDTELFARHGLPPVNGDDAPFGEVVYISAERRG